MAAQMTFQRYELKYLLNPAQKRAVLQAMDGHMELDQYGRVTIRNIYYDTETFRLIRRSLERPCYKEKLRVRSYRQVSPEEPVFVELKKKYKSVVYKRRLSLPEGLVRQSLSQDTPLPVSSQIGHEIAYFRSCYHPLIPTVFLSYQREAFYAVDGGDFRVTFDDHILYRQDQLSSPSATSSNVDLSQLFSDRDFEIGYDEESATHIQLGSPSTCDSDAVTVDGSTITITQEGTYLLTGTLEDGMVVVQAPETDKVQLVLDNAHITSATSAAIYVPSADKVFLTTAADSDNTLANGGSYVAIDDNNIDGVIFSKSDLTLNGAGTLTITSGGGSANGEAHTDNMQPGGGMGGMGGGPGSATDGQPPELPDGMQPSDNGGGMPDGSTEPPDISGQAGTELSATRITSTTTTTTEDTTSTKEFKATSALTITGGTFQLDCADDALHTNGSLTVSGGTAQISTGDDALHADLELVIEAGDLDITTCYEGLEGQSVSVSGGTINLVVSDDGINAAGTTTQNQSDIFINISGGALTIDAGGDGLDSNGTLTVSGGTILVSGSEQSADSALDCDGTTSITGGTVVGPGMSGMAQNFGDTSTQGSILVSVDSQGAGSTVSLTDQNGAVLATWEAPKSFNSVLISCPDLTVGSTYTVTAGTAQTEVTLDSLIYGGGSMQPGQMGGMGGRRP